MPEPLANPHVALNNARNLPRRLDGKESFGVIVLVDERQPGEVLDRPTGELALLWQLYARLLERNRQLTAKQHEESPTRTHSKPIGLQRPARRAA